MRQFHVFIQSLFRTGTNDSKLVFATKQWFLFGYLQAISCVFPLLIFLSLAVSSPLSSLGIARYDLLLLICIAAQVIMYYSGMETRDEVFVITAFHLLGLIMELHKVRIGSWSYPEDAITKVAGVPLYAGFMYASVGSYICQAWRNLQLDMVDWPPAWQSVPVGAAIYLNFFTNAFIPDLRWYILIVLIIIFRKTKFEFTLNGVTYAMPALLSFLIIGFFIWMAENIATFLGAWKYAYQHAGWKMVSWHKISSWSLLVIVSIIIVGQLKLLKGSRQSGKTLT